MPRFKFKYQTLLEHRRALEEQRQRELAQQLRGRMILENQLRQMQDTIRESKHQLGRGLVGKVDLDAIGRFAGFSGHTTLRAHQLVLRIAEFEKRVNVARAALQDAMRQRKALELLHEKHLEAWKHAETRRESLELDEIAMQQYTRRLLTEQAA